MKLSVQEPGFVLSGITHVALILAGLVSLSSPKPFDEMAEAVPVDVISESQFREMTKGDLKEKQVRPDTPLRVDRVAKVDEQKEQGQDKKDVPTPPPPPLRPAVKQDREDLDDADKPAPAPPKIAKIDPPKPEPVKAEPVKAPQPPARPEPAKVASAPARPEPEDDEDKEAEIIRQRALKQKQLEREKADEARKEEARKEEARKLEEKRRADEKRRAELEAAEERKEAERAKAEAAQKAAEAKRIEDEKRRADAARKLAEDNKRAAEAARKAADAKKAEDARKAAEKAESDKLQAAIRNRLLSSREAPASSGSTGQQVTRTASAGAPNATGQKLSPSDREQLMGLIKEQMERCWSITGTSNPAVKPTVRLQLTQTGHILSAPALTNSSGDPAFNAIADSGMRAIRQCAPYRIPAKFADKYDDWKTITVKLDPTDLL